MSKPFILNIDSKDTVIKCIKVSNSSEYEDTIIKFITYNNFISNSIKVINSCNSNIILPSQVLFTQQDNLGSTFTASIDNTVISAGQSVNVSVYYNGKYKGVESNPLYIFIINGITVQYRLHVVNNDNIGIIEDFSIVKENQENHIFSATDFLNHFIDIDGDSISTVSFFINVSRLRYNGVAYTEGQEIPISDIQAGKLVYLAPITELEDSISLSYNIRDTNNNIVN